MKFTKITVTVIIGLNIATASLYAKTYTLSNGKKLEDPYVISQRPDGLEIGHKKGIMFIKFALLPAEIQKKYNYNPEKAAEYEKAEQNRKAAAAKRKQEEAEKKAAFNKAMNQKRFAASMSRLELDIQKTENRIAFLKQEIPKLEKQCDELLDKTTSMAKTSVSGNNSRRTRVDYDWDGGFAVVGNNPAGSRAEYTKRRTIGKIEDLYSTTRKQLKKHQDELAKKEIELIQMKERLQKGKASLRK